MINLQKLRTSFSDYSTKYETIRMVKDSQILQLTVHTNDGPLQWGRLPHAELEDAFLHISRDRDVQVVILTGTGSQFSGPRADPETNKALHKMSAADWAELGWESNGLLKNMLAIDVPMISAVNGPALRHAELPVMCDIVLAAESASFQDSAHYVGGLVPGDGVHVVFPMVMGLNRGRYFLLTGQEVGAKEAKEIGLVNEVLPSDQLLPRAWDLARTLLKQPEMNRRYARILLTEHLRRRMHELLPYGLALEGLAVVNH